MRESHDWGMLETPIALTGSMNVGLVSAGLVEYMVHQYPGMAPGGDVTSFCRASVTAMMGS